MADAQTTSEWFERYQAGESMRSIARLSRVSPSTVSRALRDLIPARPTAACSEHRARSGSRRAAALLNDRILKMIDAETMGASTIALELGCSRARVHAVAAQAGRTIVPRTQSAPHLREVVESVSPSRARQIASDALEAIEAELGTMDDELSLVALGLTLSQARIYNALRCRPGQPVSKMVLHQALDIHRENPGEVDPAVVSVIVWQLRQRLRRIDPSAVIKTVWGGGYVLVPDAGPE
ncbi:MAG: winged helix-turn-helix domain-containing protein [Paracoccus sp. (in: a-proteobacteria)]|nr:winged helix-turn-helix domain-containing protein [Paracoccus sp. (in: a-proteobacteria)]